MSKFTFSTAKKQAAPSTAGVIPRTVLDHFFQEGLTGQEQTLMNASSEHALALLNSQSYQDLSDKEKQLCLLVLLFSPHDASLFLTLYQKPQFHKLLNQLLRTAIEQNHLVMFDRLAEQLPRSTFVSLPAFRNAIEQGHLGVLNRLIQLAPADALSMLQADNYQAFRNAAANGHLGILNRLIQLAPDEALSMVRADNYYAFRNAAFNGHLGLLNRLIELAPDDVLSMVRAYNYNTFRNAAFGGHLGVLNRLIELAPNDVLSMLQANNYDAFRYAAERGHLGVINQLLTYPSMLAHAEMHVREYGARYVQPFIRTTLDRLHTEKATFEQANPHSVFDLDSPERAQSCFYMLRHLIRCNDARYSDDIRFLLSIPAVKALAPATVTPNEANELLRLALTLGNQDAVEILFTIPAVRTLAEHNNYYQHEQQGGIDLRTLALSALAQDRESSMRALSVREQRQMQAAITRYQPMIRAGGVVHIMSDLREHLAERYTATPARLTRDDGSTLLLPMTWEAFRALELSPSEHERALQAYYQHPDHNAWRYLLKPNPWMHARASYVNVNPLNLQERWSTFDEYEDLISLLYLAAIDTQTPAEDGYTVDTRFTHFIEELAHIGRAHNWDTTRPRTNAQGHIVSEEYDDLQGDKPSCYSGVKRRLFQAVQGHPLFKLLTLNVIKAELREFMRQHFEAAINEDNQDALKEAWLALCEGEADDGSFMALNVSEAQQRDFFEYLTRKYATEFTDNGALTTYLREAFKISDTYPSHVARFAGETDFESLLPRTSSPGLS